MYDAIFGTYLYYQSFIVYVKLEFNKVSCIFTWKH